MVEKLSGIYSTVLSSFVPDIPVNKGAILVVGHAYSGASGLYASGATYTDADKWSATNNGRIYTWTSMAEAQSTLGYLTASGAGALTTGTFGSGAVSPYDPYNNMLHSLELIYTANPGAKVYGMILSGSGTNAKATPAGLTVALAASMVQKDIAFIDDCGLEFNSNVLTHCITASNKYNKAERIYIGGLSLNEAYSGSTNTSLDNTYDVSAYTNLREDNGRSVCFIGNVNHKFYIEGTNATTREIGGNLYKSYIAGLLSKMGEGESLLNTYPGYVPKYNGKTKYWTTTELETHYDNSMLSIRYDPSSTPTLYFEKAMAFAPNTATFTLITRRRIIDAVSKRIRSALRFIVRKPNIPKLRDAGKLAMLRVLSSMYKEGLIANTFDASMTVEDGDAANGIIRAYVKVRPITEVMEIDLIIGVDL